MRNSSRKAETVLRENRVFRCQRRRPTELSLNHLANEISSCEYWCEWWWDGQSGNALNNAACLHCLHTLTLPGGTTLKLWDFSFCSDARQTMSLLSYLILEAANDDYNKQRDMRAFETQRRRRKAGRREKRSKEINIGKYKQDAPFNMWAHKKSSNKKLTGDVKKRRDRNAIQLYEFRIFVENIKLLKLFVGSLFVFRREDEMHSIWRRFRSKANLEREISEKTSKRKKVYRLSEKVLWNENVEEIYFRGRKKLSILHKRETLCWAIRNI